MVREIRPKAILFDAGLVLLHPEGKKIALAFSDVFDLKIDPAICQNAYSKTIHERDSFEVPDLGDAWFWKTWCRYAQVPYKLAKEISAIIKILERSPKKLWTLVDSGAHLTLKALREAKIRLGVVSNADGELLSDLELAGLSHYFDGVIDSELIGVRKPEKRIFELGLNAMHLESPQQCWFVGDDMFHDIRPTILIGFGGVVHYDRLGIYGRAFDHHRIFHLEELLRLVSY